MVVISKPVFYEKVSSTLKCKDLVHPWTDNCMSADMKLCFSFTKGVFSFFLPIYVIRLIISYKKISKTHLKKTLVDYLKSQSFGLVYAFLTFGCICAANKFTGRLHYYGVGFIPGFVAGLSIFLEQPQNRFVNTLIWMNMLIEAVFNNLYYFKIVQFSLVRETVIFMLASSLLMHLLTNSDSNNIPFHIWFYSPHNETIKQDPTATEETTKRWLFQLPFSEFLKYFGIGYAVNSARIAVSKIGNFSIFSRRVLFSTFINKNNVKLGMVLGSYAGLFSITSYLLQTFNKKKKWSDAAIAGLVAGTAYSIKPTNSFLSIAIVTILQILCKYPLLKSSLLANIPFTELLFMISNGVLFHNRLFAFDTCPRYYAKMLKTASTGIFDQIYATAVKNYLL